MKIINNIIQISVTELSRLGSKKFPFAAPGPSLKRAAMGRQAQQLYQDKLLKNIKNYETEISVQRRDIIDDYEVFLGGRIDGQYWKNKKLILEEIKSVTLSSKEFKKLEEETFQNHRNQLAIYQWLVSLEFPGIDIEARLVYINLIDEKIRILPLGLSTIQCKNIYNQQIEKIFKLIEENKQHLLQRRKAIDHLKWPFDGIRDSQSEMIEAVSNAIENQQHLMINAPTGTGKTIGSLFPTIQHALENDLKVMFLTSKTTQQLLAKATVSQILSGSTGVISLRLKATRKMCANDHYFCNELICKFAKDYQKKIEENNIIGRLIQLEQIEPEDIFEIAKNAEACPAETMLQLVSKADILIGDINYAFDPIAHLKQLFQDDYSHIIPIIDEAHNLYPRIQDTYSPSLAFNTIDKMIEYCKNKDDIIYSLLFEWFSSLGGFYRDLNFRGEIEYAEQERYIPEINLDEWFNKKEELDELFIAYFLYKVKNIVLIENDPIESFYFDFSFFVDILSYTGKEFYHVFEAADGGNLQIFCTDPGKILSNRMNGFHNGILMSATLKPFEFFAQLSGINRKKASFLDLSSPFLTENLKVIINKSVSTRYKDRTKNSLDISEYINNTLKYHSGNYLLFFPSFDFLEMCWPFIRADGYSKIKQPIRSSDAEREEILGRLKNEKNVLLFAVMGGVFSEGVDYPGDMAIGAYIISPALPPYNFYSELQSYYFEKEYEKGEEYTYIYPGMNKVIQSAGRIIRRENDRGIIFLIGNRFTESKYRVLFPENWFRNGQIFENKKVKKIIQEFWNSESESK